MFILIIIKQPWKNIGDFLFLQEKAHKRIRRILLKRQISSLSLYLGQIQKTSRYVLSNQKGNEQAKKIILRYRPFDLIGGVVNQKGCTATTAASIACSERFCACPIRTCCHVLTAYIILENPRQNFQTKVQAIPQMTLILCAHLKSSNIPWTLHRGVSSENHALKCMLFKACSC